MLRGLDFRGTGDKAEQLIIKVADREPVSGEITLYLDEAADGDAERRQQQLRDGFRQLRAAGVLEDISVRTWQDIDVASCYEEFVGAVGKEELTPHFRSLAGGNAIDVPCAAVVIRRDGDLAGLYPRSDGDDEQTPVDCLQALCAGEAIDPL